VSDAATAVSWLLKQAEPEARRLAAQQIAKVTGVAACGLLRTALADEDWRVRKEAAVVAASMVVRDEVIEVLIDALDEKVNVGLRNAAVEALVAIGPSAVRATVTALQRLDADGRKLAVEILGGIPDDRSVAALARALADTDSNVRSAAAEALGSSDRAGDDARTIAVNALVSVLSSDEVFLKLAALDALTRLGADLPWKTFEPFVRDSVLRRYAISAAARSDDVDALDALAAATVDSSRTIVREAIVAIGERLFAYPSDADFKSGIEQRVRARATAHDRVRGFAKQHDDPRARAAALLVLGLFGDTADLPLFVEALVDDELAQHAERALQSFGSNAVGPLLVAARSEVSAVRASVLSLVPTLHPGPTPELHTTLVAALDDESPEVVAAALRVLASSGSARDIMRIASFASHTDLRIAAAAGAAISSLAMRHKAEARRAFDGIGASSPEASVACLVIGALARVGALEEDDLAVLDLALAHGDARARRAALDALALVGGDAASDAVAFALADEERDVQLAAIRALGVLGRTDVLTSVSPRLFARLRCTIPMRHSRRLARLS
jgi:HEAT repeat protein